MNRKENTLGKRLSDEKPYIALFDKYEGKRVAPNNNRYYRILRNKRFLMTVKLALIASLTLGMSNGSESEIRNTTYLAHINKISSSSTLVKSTIPKMYQPLLSSAEDIKNELAPRTNIFIGDSRTQGMMLSGAIDESESIYGVGYGLNWFLGNGEFNETKTNALDGAIAKLRNMLLEGKRYNIIIWLGVNDLKYNSASRYFEKFINLATELQDQKFYIVSVGPVRENENSTVTNRQINKFNEELKELIRSSGIGNLEYIDLSDYDLQVQKYDSAGLHYGYQDYRNIHDIIETALEESKALKLNNR